MGKGLKRESILSIQVPSGPETVASKNPDVGEGDTMKLHPFGFLE